jgi:peroxiredoxin
MLTLGTKAPAFRLPSTEKEEVSIEDFSGAKALCVVFMCNHCPYVKHIREHFVRYVRDYQKRGVAFVGINSNDVYNYPDDSPGHMARLSKELGFSFPYLYDESQEVAKAYQAACTPDFFLFDGDRKLVYRGQYDSSRPGNDIALTGEDLGNAIDAVLEGKPVVKDQRPSLGCNIKWKAGNSPDYFMSPS